MTNWHARLTEHNDAATARSQAMMRRGDGSKGSRRLMTEQCDLKRPRYTRSFDYDAMGHSIRRIMQIERANGHAKRKRARSPDRVDQPQLVRTLSRSLTLTWPSPTVGDVG